MVLLEYGWGGFLANDGALVVIYPEHICIFF